LLSCQSRPSSPDLRFHMTTERLIPSPGGRRIVICDYNALLLSVTGLLRMSGYAVFQAHDGWAAQELCILLPDIELLVLNTYGTGIDVAELCRNVRRSKRGLPILHIGTTKPDGLPDDVPTLSESFNADGLLSTVEALLQPGLMRGERDPSGQRRGDTDARQAASRVATAPMEVGGHRTS